jgi:hypothetical protein
MDPLTDGRDRNEGAPADLHPRELAGGYELVTQRSIDAQYAGGFLR